MGWTSAAMKMNNDSRGLCRNAEHFAMPSGERKQPLELFEVSMGGRISNIKSDLLERLSEVAVYYVITWRNIWIMTDTIP